MNAPRKRIELYLDPGNVDRIEVLLLGDPDEIAEIHVRIRRELEQCRGLHGIKPLAMSGCVIGWEAMLSIRAGTDDVLAVVLGMLGAIREELHEPWFRIDSEGRSAVVSWG